jgi:hypothetical protein
MWAALVAAILLAPAPDPPAPPPSRIVFASARTGVAQLYSMEPSGDGLAQLTFGAGNWGFPIPSPDGRFVAAFRGRELWQPYTGDSVAAARPDLWLMRADGSNARLVSRNVGGAYWSGDSRRLVFTGADGDTYSVGAVGGRRQLFPSGPYNVSPTPSPDGRSIAFFQPPDHVGATLLIVRRKGHERTVARVNSGRIVWSPNGRWLAIRTVDKLAVVRATGGVVNVFSALSYCNVACAPGVGWSPDSRRLAFETDDGIEVGAPSRAPPTLLVKGPTQGFAWSPRGDSITFATRSGVRLATLDGHVRDLLSSGPNESLPGIGWSPGRTALRYRPPEEAALLVRVSPRELDARFPIRQLSADGDRVAYWLCPHVLGAWRPGDAQPVSLGGATLGACRFPETQWYGNDVYDLALAGDRLAYVTVVFANEIHTALMFTTLARGTEGDMTAEGAASRGFPIALGDAVGAGSTLVYGFREPQVTSPHPAPEEIWRIDGAKPVQITHDPQDLQPLSVDQGRIVARRSDGSLLLLDSDGGVLRTFDVSSLGAVLAGDDLVVLVRGELRVYSASTGELLSVWPLPDVPSSGHCRLFDCPKTELTLDDAARGVVLYTVDGVVHLLRLSYGTDVAIVGATAAELTDAGLFYAYPGEEPWPGRIRFVPFDELPL